MEGPLGARFEVGANARGKARNGNNKAGSSLLRKMYKAAIASQQQNRQHVANEISKLQRSVSLPVDYSQPAPRSRRVPKPSSRPPQQPRRAKTAAGGVRVGRRALDVTSSPDAWMPLEV